MSEALNLNIFCLDKIIILLCLLLFYPFLSDALQGNHHFCYMFSVLTVKAHIPLGHWASVAVYNNRQVAYYCNKDKKWIKERRTIDEPKDSRDWYLYQLNTLSNCTVSQCSELHVLQRIIGCELVNFPNGTESLRAFDEYGFDGEDFIAFNSDTLQWIDKNPKAKETKIKWDLQTKRNQFIKQYLNDCMTWISTLNNTKKTPPDVRVFARKAPDDHSKLVLSCLATGFYPRYIKMSIRLNKINTENQISSGIRPNADGSFQMRVSVEIDRNHKGSYDCQIIHSGLTEPVTVDWDGICNDCETEFLWLVIAGATVLFLVLTVISYCIYKKKRSNVYTYRCDDGDRNHSEQFSYDEGGYELPQHRQIEVGEK